MLQGLPMSAVTDGVSTPGGASHAPSSDAIRKAINEIQVSIFSIPVFFIFVDIFSRGSVSQTVPFLRVLVSLSSATLIHQQPCADRDKS